MDLSSYRPVTDVMHPVFVLDADVKNIPKSQKNIVLLPSLEKMALEKELYSFFAKLPDSDPFWNLKLQFTSQVLFRGYNDLSYTEDIQNFKDWLGDISKRNLSYCGENGEKLMTYWRDRNKKICRDFCEKLFIAMDSTFSKKEKLSAEVKEFILSQYEEKVDLPTENDTPAVISEQEEPSPVRRRRPRRFNNEEQISLGLDI